MSPEISPQEDLRGQASVAVTVEIGPSARNKNLDGLNLSGAEIYILDIAGSSVRYGNFDGANISILLAERADLTGLLGRNLFCHEVSASNARLVQANLRSARFNTLTSKEGDFTDAVMVDFQSRISSVFSSTKFDGVLATRARFSGLISSNTSWVNAVLDFGRFDGLLLNADFTGASLRNTDFPSIERTSRVGLPSEQKFNKPPTPRHRIYEYVRPVALRVLTLLLDSFWPSGPFDATKSSGSSNRPSWLWVSRRV